MSEIETKLSKLYDQLTILPKNCTKGNFNSEIKFANNTKILRVTSTGNRTETCHIPLPENCQFTIKLIKVNDPNYVAFGFSNRVINENRGWLGYSLDKGNWGIYGHKYISEEGKGRGHFAQPFKEGDSLTLIVNGNTISYKVNDVDNDYKYVLEGEKLYFAYSHYHKDDTFEIVN
jgi:hypothetical protein